MSLDIYVWLAWRLHRLTKATGISWPHCMGSSALASKPSANSSRVSSRRWMPHLLPIRRPAWSLETRRSPFTRPGRRSLRIAWLPVSLNPTAPTLVLPWKSTRACRQLTSSWEGGGPDRRRRHPQGGQSIGCQPRRSRGSTSASQETSVRPRRPRAGRQRGPLSLRAGKGWQHEESGRACSPGTSCRPVQRIVVQPPANVL